MENNTNFNDDISEYHTLFDIYYKISIGGHTFQILKLFSDNHAQYSILDSRGRDCVNIVIQSRRDDSRAYLSQITYRPTCAIGESMSRGSSTVLMIKALLIMVMRDTNFDRIYLKDKSQIDCVLPGAEDALFKVSLGLLSFILHGKTWYQKHFGAIPLSDKTRQQLSESNILLESSMTTDDANQLIGRINEDADYYRSITGLAAKAINIITANIGKSWRTVCIELFSGKMRENAGCLLFEILRGFLIETFKLPDLTDINMYILRETVLEYSEPVTIEKNDTPVHTDKKRKDMLLKSSMLLNGAAMYMIGGKKTLKAHIKHIPHEYGRNIAGYMNRRRTINGTRRKRNTFNGSRARVPKE
jgi:hypothetical protein